MKKKLCFITMVTGVITFIILIVCAYILKVESIDDCNWFVRTWVGTNAFLQLILAFIVSSMKIKERKDAGGTWEIELVWLGWRVVIGFLGVPLPFLAYNYFQKHEAKE